MFLDKKECEFFKLISRNKRESVYKIGRPYFSTVTITKKVREFEKRGLIKIELIERRNRITLTDKGKIVLNGIDKIMENTV